MSKDLNLSRIWKRIKHFYTFSENVVASTMLTSGHQEVRKEGSTRIVLAYLLLVCILKFVIYIWLLQNTEMIWDRIIVVLTIGISIHFLNNDRKVDTFESFFISFTLITYFAQIIYAGYNNDFGEVYLLDLLLSLIFVPCTLYRSYIEDIVLFSISAVMLFFSYKLDLHYEKSEQFLIYFILFTCAAFRVFRKYFGHKRSFMSIHEQFLLEMVVRSENAIFITDFEGFILDSNPAAETYFGYGKEELKGKNFSIFRKDQLTYDQDVSGLKEIFQDRFWRSDIPLLRKDGSEFEAYVSISLIQRQDGDYLIYRVKDISDIVDAERLLKAERDKAEAAVKAKSLFLATMSHEIRTPMNGVVGMANVLSTTDLSKEQRDYVQTINRSTESLVRIINDILDFSKIEANKIQIEKAPFNLHLLLTDVVKLYGPMTDAKDLSLSLKIGTNVPKVVEGDSLRLKQIINNLVNNAIKFTESGNVQLFVDNVKSFPTGWNIKFEVKDTGSGIPKKKMDLLFKSFSQLDSSDARKFGGSGLGLAICQGLVQLMGGNISVQSTEGVGTSFIFDIPFELSEVTDIDQTNVELLDIKLAKYELSTLNVLLAEDNEINQKVAEIICSSLGITLDIVENGLEAIDAYAKKPYDLIFMDIQMPVMDGIEATEKLFKDYSSDSLPKIIALTANGLEEDKKKCYAAGMSAFLSKPIHIPELKMILLQYMEDRNLVKK